MAFDTIKELMALTEGKSCKTDVKPAVKLAKKKKNIKEALHHNVQLKRGDKLSVHDEFEVVSHDDGSNHTVEPGDNVTVQHQDADQVFFSVDGHTDDFFVVDLETLLKNASPTEAGAVKKAAADAASEEVHTHDHFVVSTAFEAKHFNDEYDEEIPEGTEVRVHHKSGDSVIFESEHDGSNGMWITDIETFLENTDPL
ncbi:MAG: hypothetical protein QXN55_00780 [Candidatus Nitrosotenuis sp.]